MSDTKNSSKTVIILLIVLIVIVSAIAAFAGYMIFFKKLPSPSGKPADNKVLKTIEEKVFQMDEFVANLSDKKYIKTELYLSFNEEALNEELAKDTSQIRDIINMTLIDTSSIELEGNSLVNVKEKLIERINRILINGKITNIYFNEILIQ